MVPFESVLSRMGSTERKGQRHAGTEICSAKLHGCKKCSLDDNYLTIKVTGNDWKDKDKDWKDNGDWKQKAGLHRVISSHQSFINHSLLLSVCPTVTLFNSTTLFCVLPSLQIRYGLLHGSLPFLEVRAGPSVQPRFCPRVQTEQVHTLECLR